MKSQLVLQKVMDVFKSLDELRELDKKLEIGSLGIALFLELFERIHITEEEFNEIVDKYRNLIDGGKQ